MYVKYSYAHSIGHLGDMVKSWAITNVGEDVQFRREWFPVLRQEKRHEPGEFNYYYCQETDPAPYDKDEWSLSRTPEELANYALTNDKVIEYDEHQNMYGETRPIIVTWTDKEGRLHRLVTDSDDIYLINDRGDTIQNLGSVY